MKRYWKIISLTAFIILTFSIFYIQAVITGEDLPEFEMETVFGDDKEKENLIISGNYEVNQFLEPFSVTSTGTTYAKDSGYFERSYGFYQHPLMKEFIEEHRSFMRGKQNDIELFYEDDEKLYYVGPYSPLEEFDVEILDKATNDEQIFSVEIPREEQLSYIQVTEIQLVEEQLHVFTLNHYAEKEQLHVYKIDVKEEKITNHNPVIDGTENSHAYILNNYHDISQKDYLVIRVDHMKWNEEMYYDELLHSEFIAYNTKTGEKQILEISEELNTHDPFAEESPQMTTSYSVQDDLLYSVSFVSEGLKIETYNLKSGKSESTKIMELDQSVMAGLNGLDPQENKLYFFSNMKEKGNDTRHLFIADLQTGDLIYQGEIKITNVPKETPIFNIEFHSIRLK